MTTAALENDLDNDLDAVIDVAAATRSAYREARAAGQTRHRDIAAHLGLSEGALIAAHVASPEPGLKARRLTPQWSAIVQALESVGEVMALTRNAACVHEKAGHYTNASATGLMGLVLGSEIDLRVFYRHWAHGFAVDESKGPDGIGIQPQRSLQFFDASGTAVHKVFTKPRTDLDAWHALVRGFASHSHSTHFATTPPAARAGERADADIDLAAFHADWSALRDTHEFFGLLKAHGLTRTQALRLATPAWVRAVDNGSARDLLRAAAGSTTPIMVFTGNPGMIQIHSGPVRRVEVMGPWLNVLDERFNLHLREDHIAQSWVVRKPTSDGVVTSLELFDQAGETIAMFFGERKPGRPELCAWRRLVDRLVGEADWAADGAGCAAC